MKDSILNKLHTLLDRHEEVAGLLADPDVINDQNQFRGLSQEYSQLEPIVNCFRDFNAANEDLNAAEEMLKDDDADVREMAVEEKKDAREKTENLELHLQKLLLPKDPNDDSNIFLEIRAGTGGDEAAIFAGDLFRMYSRFAEIKRWQVEIINQNIGEHGGYREIIARIIGNGAYSQLKFESGAHRVQRVPETESQGRVHTSAATVVVMPEVAEVAQIEINSSDLRIDTFRASGSGGQHVNKTDSAVRLTHLPTGTVVECQDERSQHKNRAYATKLLRAKIYEYRMDQKRKDLEKFYGKKGEIAWGSQIRSYVMQPYTMVKDHRTGCDYSNVIGVLDGDIGRFMEAYLKKSATEK